MDIKLYTIGCPMCLVLERKLNEKGIPYEKIEDVEVMKQNHIEQVPVLSVENKNMLFGEAIKWVNNYEC